MSSRFRFAALLICVMTLSVTVGPVGASGPPSLDPEPLPPGPFGVLSQAERVNNAGQIISGAVVSAMRWEQNGTFTVLPPLPGDDDAHALDLNDRGMVVGTSSNGRSRPVLWEADGTPVALPFRPTARHGTAYGINNRGDVVGYDDALDGEDWGILWRADGGIVNLDPLPGHDWSEANHVNDRGQAVGRSEGPDGELAVLWDSTGNPTALLPLPGGTESNGWAINNRGDIAGHSVERTDEGNVWRAVIWPAGEVHPTALPLLPGHGASFALDINENGWIAGEILTRTGPSTAVLWSPTGEVIELNPLPGHSRATPNGLNDHLTVVGHSGANPTVAVIWDVRGAARQN